MTEDYAERPSPRATRAVASTLDRFNPLVVVAVLLVLLLLGGVLTAWRYVADANRAPSSYYEFQLQRWEQLLPTRPEDPAIWATLGSLHAKSGDEKAAQRSYDRALELDPSNTSALVYRAGVAERDGDYSGAVKLLEDARDSLPERGRYLVLFELGETHRRAGETEKAIAAYKASIADNGTFWNAPYRLAFLLEASGDLDGALAAARSAQRFDASNAKLNALIESLVDRGAKSKDQSSGEAGMGGETP